MNDNEREKIVRRIVIFSLLVTAMAWMGPLLGGSPASPGPGFILWGIAPLLGSLLMRVVARDWTDTGFKPALEKNAAWYLTSIFAYPLIMVAALFLGSMLSVSAVSDFSLVPYLKTALTALPIFFIFAFFEEFGWRGYLVPKLASTGISPLLLHAIVAVVWATWHLPFIRELTWLYTSENLLTFIPRLYLGAFAFSILYDEIRIVSGSFWPAVLLHAIGNAFGHPFVADYLAVSPGMEFIGSVGFDGLLMMVFFALLGMAIRRRMGPIPGPAHR